jgi:hypothetical protein
MFRRMAEAFADPHASYLDQQGSYYDTLPNMILAPTSGLPGFDKAIQSADPSGKGRQEYAVERPNEIFRSDVTPSLAALAAQCSSSTVDELIAAGGGATAGGLGCGWMYTPPPRGSGVPVLSKGALGDAKGPARVGHEALPSYKKWFFDLQEAKRTALLDKCKAMNACTDLDQNAGCGWCQDTNQGVPVDAAGKPLYPSDPRGGCTAVVKDAASCPAPPAGPQPVLDRTCEPVSGRLSATCLYRHVMSAGCTDRGALAVALGSPSPGNYIGSIENGKAMSLYQRVAQPPLALDVFRQGATTVDAVLREVRQLAANTAQPTNSAIGAAARDLCLQRGAVNGYNDCFDLPDTQPAPFELACLQQIFLKMGGQPAGTAYPSAANIASYNSMGTLGAVKQSWSAMASRMRGVREGFADVTDYDAQRTAMTQFLGITPEKGIARAPYTQGVEVLWMVCVPSDPKRVAGFLKRTIERDWVQLRAGPSGVSQLGGLAYGCMVQMTDVRVPSDAAVQYTVTVDDGFWIATNQPADVDRRAMATPSADEPGLFENNGYQGPTKYDSKAVTIYRGGKPNITKAFYQDCGGGWNAFELVFRPMVFKPAMYSLTCERNAPFLTYEVSPKSGAWEELRNPGLFGQFMGAQNPEYHLRAEEKLGVPGKKAFMRMNGASSALNMPNLAFQSWRTMTFAVRFQTMPVKETMLHVFHGGVSNESFAVVATPRNGSTAGVQIEKMFYTNGGTVATPWTIEIGKWYLLVVHNRKTEFQVGCASMDGWMSSNGAGSFVTVSSNGQAMWKPNATWNPTPGQNLQACNLLLGGGLFKGQWGGIYGSSAFQFDLGWVHFFDREAGGEEIVRECKADWVYTAFPEAYDQYKVLG